ncbi:organic cation transporter-like protein isoform X2 [Hydractinia symbiolongicarpus]|uniref:organic cation transporter-like protein isoform X2 n=1 Tax=Hydractinia symbiolongicarpus TaxID=13093 RepID=UPI00254DE3D6|nr:organic cation transporter-like protein isoform X2 [Hydractinia symbiolongicarpus]
MYKIKNLIAPNIFILGGKNTTTFSDCKQLNRVMSSEHEETKDEKVLVDSSDNFTDVDSIIVSIGEYGKSQIILTAMFCLIMIPPVYQTLSMAFVAYNPSWRCSELGKVTGQCTKDGTFSSGEDGYQARCEMNRSAWEFTKSKKFSIVTEFDLVCEKKELAVAANSAMYLGWAVGAIVLGWVSDRYGRKIVLFPSYFVVILASFAAGYSPNFGLFFFLRGMIGFFLGGVILTLFIVCAELVGPKQRALASTLVWFAFTTSLCMLGLQAYLLPDWRLLLKVTSMPYVILILLWKFIPESVRWLHVKGRNDEAEKILRKVAKVNKNAYPASKLCEISQEKSSGSFRNLFSTKKITMLTLSMCFIWFVNGMVYYGISLASDDLGGNMYRDFVLTSLVEIPGNILVIVLSNRYGRKKATTGSMFITAFSLLVVAIIPGRTENHAYNWSRVSFGMLGKLFITTAFDSVYILAAELYPTVVRSQAMALLSVVSRVGAASAPWVAQGLRVLHFTVPFYFMGVLTLVAALMCLTLTETKGKPTAETFCSDTNNSVTLEVKTESESSLDKENLVN